MNTKTIETQLCDHILTHWTQPTNPLWVNNPTRCYLISYNGPHNEIRFTAANNVYKATITVTPLSDNDDSPTTAELLKICDRIDSLQITMQTNYWRTTGIGVAIQRMLEEDAPALATAYRQLLNQSVTTPSPPRWEATPQKDNPATCDITEDGLWRGSLPTTIATEFTNHMNANH